MEHRMGRKDVDEMVSIPALAREWATTRGALWNRLRRDPNAPPVVYVGPRSPRIRRSDVERYVEAMTAQRRATRSAA